MKSDEPDIFLHYNLCHYVHVKFDLEQYYFWRGFILDLNDFNLVSLMDTS